MERARPELSRVTWTRPAAALARRPRLWPVALAQAFRLAPRGWWRRWPPVPRPDVDYFRFRVQTQYGDPDHVPEPEDLLDYLEWCRTERRYLG